MGNRVATLVRRLISRLIRSHVFVVLSRLRWLDGKREGRQSLGHVGLRPLAAGPSSRTSSPPGPSNLGLGPIRGASKPPAAGPHFLPHRPPWARTPWHSGPGGTGTAATARQRIVPSGPPSARRGHRWRPGGRRAGHGGDQQEVPAVGLGLRQREALVPRMTTRSLSGGCQWPPDGTRDDRATMAEPSRSGASSIR